MADALKTLDPQRIQEVERKVLEVLPPDLTDLEQAQVALVLAKQALQRVLQREEPAPAPVRPGRSPQERSESRTARVFAILDDTERVLRELPGWWQDWNELEQCLGLTGAAIRSLGRQLQCPPEPGSSRAPEDLDPGAADGDEDEGSYAYDATEG